MTEPEPIAPEALVAFLEAMGIAGNDSRAWPIFYQHALQKMIALRASGRRLVHYTSAEVATHIFRGRAVWMRKSSTMNDFKEIEYGMECLAGVWNDLPGAAFRDLLNELFSGLADEVTKLFNAWLPHFRTETYLTCLSEHLDEEDNIGRLSMWRAYGGNAGVALVLNNSVFTNPMDALGAYTTPVAYLSPAAFDDEFARVFNAMHQNRDVLSAFGRDRLRDHCFQLLKMAVLATKHPGFHEEREWRVIYSPTQTPSPHLAQSLEVVRGTPQRVYKLPLRDDPAAGVVGLEPAVLLDRLIVGPTSYPEETVQAFVELLTSAGVENAQTKVVRSDIPLRQW
jgi:hypothetical protein